jgi:hypothetical protein
MREVASARLRLLRPLSSASYDSWGTSSSRGATSYDEIISNILNWVDEKAHTKNDTKILWMHGDERSTTSDIARNVAVQASENGQLLASFFFSWTGAATMREPANLIPTIMYQIALFDNDFLRRIVGAIGRDRDIRDKAANIQISTLLKRSFQHAIMPFSSQPLIVIDALDVCNGLHRPQVVEDIGSFLQVLVSEPFFVKVLVTSRFKQPIRRLLEGSNAIRYQSVALPALTKEQFLQVESEMLDSDRGTELFNSVPRVSTYTRL